MQSQSNTGLIVSVVIVSLILGVVGGLGGAYFLLQEQTAPEQAQGVTSPGPGEQRVEVITDEEAIVKAVDEVDPAVVKIIATTVNEPSNPFEYFFGGGQPQVQRGIGSGFVFDYNGRKLILTNRHVVGGAQEIEVQTRDGEKFKAKPLGEDSSSDVAVLELQGDVGDFPTVTLGNSDQLDIGEWVVAIGHPFAFDHTVTVGVVSAQGQRSVGPQAPARNMIQTDAAINQGNSGGPLINLAGEVIGINSMIFSPTGATVGIGFAIPINDVKQVVRIMMEGGPWIGIMTRPNSRGLANYLGLQTDKGVVVIEVMPDGPAENAGLQQGDVILAIDGTEITGGSSLQEIIFGREIGDSMTFRIQRGSEEMELEVTAGTAPEGYFR